MPRLYVVVDPRQVRGLGGEGFAGDAGTLAQAGEIEQRHRGHQSCPTSRLPPRLPTSFAGPSTIACDSALHMS